MKKKTQKKEIALRVTATALTAVLVTAPAQPVAQAISTEISGIHLLSGEQQEQTATKQLYTVGNTSYEGNASTPKGNGHDCQHLGIWVPAGVTFKIRQTNKNLGQNLTVKMRNDDRLTEAAYTLKSDGSWLEITPTADSVPLISSVYNAKGEKPQVEYTVEGTKELPVYEFGDDELAFYKEWDELNAPFAVFQSKYTIWLVPAKDKTNNKVGSLDDLLLWYDNMITQYNAFSGLSLDAAEPWNRDSGTKYFIKANRNGWGAAYYSVVETAPNSDSLLGYMDTGNWGPLHEVGHGYNTVNFNSAEIWNNVLSHYYQVAAFGAGRWLGLSEENRARYETQRSTLNYFGTEQYDAKLYFWVNMLDKLGPQKTSAFAYQLYRGNQANGIANLGGHDFYVNAYTKGSGFNVSAWFDMWGFTVADSTKQALIEAEAYRNVYPLRNLVADDATAETIRAALGLTSKYSLVETQELQTYFKTAAPLNGTLNIHLDDTTLEAIKDQKIRITDGVNTVQEVTVTGKDLTVELPIGYYNILVSTAKGDEFVILNNRLGYTVIGEGQTAEYDVTAEKLTSSNDFVDWTIRFGANYSYSGVFCTATTDIAKGTLRVTTVACNPHIYQNTYSYIKVFDETGAEVYSKICPGTGTTAEDKTVNIKPGYTIEVYQVEPGRGLSVSSSAMSGVKLVNNDIKTSKYKVTEYGLEMLDPTEMSGEQNYYDVLSAYMDTLKDANAKADFQNPEKLPAEKAKVTLAVQKMPADQQQKFETEYAGYYPFDQGVQEMTIAAIPAQDYTGSPVTPALDITVGGKTLTDSDYRAEWTLNTDVGTARVKVYGLGQYENCIGEATFEIRLPDSLQKEFTVVSEYASVEFSSGAKRPGATVTIGGKTLTRGVDYILAYANNTSVGTATITANGIGNYAGISGSTTFEITNKIVDMTVTVNPTKVNLDASGATTGVTVMVGKKQLTEGTDYTVSFSDNTAVGTATVTVTGIGNYDGSVGSATYEITQPLNPDPIGGTVFSNWRYNMNGYGWTRNYSVMTFDMENSTLTVEHGTGQPHSLINGVYATISVFDTDGSRSYYKEYIGNQNNYQPTDTVKLGLGYIVQLTFSEPEKSGSAISSTASGSVTLKPKTARYIVTERGLQEITADGSTAANDMAANYVTTLRAYMDQLKKDNPVQEDFWDAAKFPEQKAIVEKGVTLLTPEELAQFKEDYAGYYPFAAPDTYTVEYDWGTEFPEGETLPTDSNTYQTEEAALAAMETGYTDQSTSNAKKDGLTGTWTFSGWTGKLDGTVVKFTGKWTFTADIPLVDAEVPAAITLTDAEYEEGQTAAPLDGSTTVADNGTITYQWYSSNAADNFNGTAIDGETGETFVPNTDAAGIYFYYVVATNTNENATGSKTASVTSSMATITVTEPDTPVSYTVAYDWGNEFPADAALPQDTDTYQHIADAKSAMDTAYNDQTTSVAQKDGRDGIWRFSGWTASVEGTVVKFTGHWTFTEEGAVDAALPAPIHLDSANYRVGSTAAPLNGETTVSDGGRITYQWYQAASADDFAGMEIQGATDPTYTPATDVPGTYYYFVTATNTNENAAGSKTASVTSSMAVIKVTRATPAAPSGNHAPSYAVSTAPAANGSISASARSAAKGSTVTISVKPEDGYELASLTVRDSSGNEIAVTKQADDRYTFVMPDGKVSVDASFTKIAATVNFNDVARSAYYYDAVQWAVEKGITEGTSATTFSPDASCTRAQMVTFLYRAAGSPAPKSTVNPFADVSASDYYYNAVLWAVENGITTGVSADCFAPGAAVSRAQTVTFLYRAAGSPTSGSSGFSDVSANAYYAKAVAWANENGITTGTGNGRFSPNADCTRGQIVTFLYRADN